MSHVPFNRVALAGPELEYIRQAVDRMHLSGDGMFTEKCSRLIERQLHVGRVMLTTSCTHALEMAALLLEIQPGDQVIVPSYTFVSTINAFVLRGAVPVFADIRPDTFNLDETRLERHVSTRTRAIVAVHYAGVACEMDTILDIAGRHGLPVIEDNAHGLFGRYKGRSLGSFGDMAALSFHETKNVTCGEGGALILNDPSRVARAEILREKGTDRSRFFRGECDKYTWVDIGSSYLPSEILAAFLYAQLEGGEGLQAHRRGLWNRYYGELQAWAQRSGVRLPIVPPECEQSYHMFYLLMPSPTARQAIIAQLKSDGVHAAFHYLPLHLSPMGRRFGGSAGDCPVTEDVSDRLVRLPLSGGLTPEEQSRVLASVTRFQ
jgi:dTDP-4-amino-4,6-dideoxygalactose transaminase